MAARLTYVIPLLALACASPPPPEQPLQAPPVVTQVDYHAGTLLTGPRAGSPDRPVAPAESLAVRCHILYLERLPEKSLASLASRTRMVIAPDSGTPITSHVELALRARIGSGDEAVSFLAEAGAAKLGRVAEVADLEGVLLPGVTAVFSVRDAKPRVGADGQVAEGRAAVHLALTPEAKPALGLFLEGPAEDPLADGSDHTSAGAARLVQQREFILPEVAPEIGGAPVVLVFPSRLLRPAGSAFVMVLTVQPAPVEPEAKAAHDERVARCLSAVAGAGKATLLSTTNLNPEEARLLEMRSVWSALPHARAPRAALVFLASSTAASLAEDLAMVADDAMLALYVREVLAERGDLEAADVPGIGWLLERTAYRFLAQRVGEGELPPGSAVLLRRAGQAGRFADALAAGLTVCRDLASFQAFLVEENRSSLVDTTPAARVRAFDWLAARGLAPAGFEPTATLVECRAALAKVPAAANQEVPRR